MMRNLSLSESISSALELLPIKNFEKGKPINKGKLINQNQVKPNIERNLISALWFRRNRMDKKGLRSLYLLLK